MKKYKFILLILLLVATQGHAGDSASYTLRTGNISFTVSAKYGGRIISFTCNGKELLITPNDHLEAFGATFWPSPQRNWKWPPYPVLDTQAYQYNGNRNHIKLTSAPDTASGFQFEKEFTVSAADTSINIIYTIRNITSVTKQVAGWDVCRVQGGLSFFPVNDTVLSPLPKSTPLSNTSLQDGICWYNFSVLATPQPQKLFSTARGGWLAHVSNGLLFVKTFPDIAVAQLPPTQGEVEIYYQKAGQYIELENHGPYTFLAPGETLIYKEKWYLSNLQANASKADMIALARQKAATAHGAGNKI